jgi:acetylornithine deacetylase/succinyl-diaminopimelate desuccinylase-like protein
MALLVANVGLTAPGTYSVAPETQAVYDKLAADAAVKKALDYIKADDANTLNEQKTICEIPSPPFKEQVRAADYKKRLEAVGVKDVKMDAEGNVFGLLSGTGKGPTLLVTAHLDTVFPEGTDVTVKETDGKLYAPGIGDDTRSLAALLSLIRAFKDAGLETVGDVIVGGNVGEEGLGDLRGVKALFKDNPSIDGYISIDGGGTGGITYLATGSHRFEITFKGPGGHSFGAFGTPSAIHAMGRAIAKIADFQVPKNPKTTFTVGTVAGGTSVNSIAGDGVMLVDMRSNDEAEVLNVEAKFRAACAEAVVEENARWNSDKISVDIKLVGDRPAGTASSSNAPVQAAYAASKALGQQATLDGPSSTDINLPVFLGIPAICIGGGGGGGRGHSVDEWYENTDAYLGPQHVLMTILGLAGVKGATEPLLQDGAVRPILLETNGELQLTPAAPKKTGDLVTVPLRVAVENLGGQVKWDEATQSAEVQLGTHTLKVAAGSAQGTLDGTAKTLAAAVQIINDRMMVPLDALTLLGVKGEYVDSNMLVTLTF